MKRFSPFLLLLPLLLLPTALRAQSVTIENAEDEILVYALVPAVPMPTAAEIRESVEDGELELRYLPPLATVTGVPRSGDSALVGAYVSAGRGEHPVVLAELEEDYLTVSRAYTQTGPQGRVITAADALLRSTLESEPILIDNEYLDWDRYEPNAAFSPAGPPSQVEQTRAGVTRRRFLDESLYWGKGGTSVERLKLVSSAAYAYVMVETRSAISRGASYFLYAYDERTQGQASYTIEIPVTDGSSGLVLLWTPRRDQPRVVGEFVYEPFFLEARIDLSRAPGWLPVSADGLSFDFSSAFSGARVTEEFFYTTLYARDIVYRSPAGL